MGMFSKDVLFGGTRLDAVVGIGEKDAPEFAEKVIVLDAQVLSQVVPTDIGNAQKTVLTICRTTDAGLPSGDPFQVGTLASAIAGKVAEGEPGDLPAIVVFFTTTSSFGDQNDALVMQFISRYDGPDINVAPLVDPFTGEVSELTAMSGKPAPAKKAAKETPAAA